MKKRALATSVLFLPIIVNSVGTAGKYKAGNVDLKPQIENRTNESTDNYDKK